MYCGKTDSDRVKGADSRFTDTWINEVNCGCRMIEKQQTLYETGLSEKTGAELAAAWRRAMDPKEGE